MLPFVRTQKDLKEVKKLLKKAGLKRTKDFMLYILVGVPSTVIMIDELIDLGIDGVSIDLDRLTLLTLGIDKDNPLMTKEYDERNEAVQRSIQHVISACSKKNVSSSICKRTSFMYPELIEKGEMRGVSSVSVNSDSIEQTRRTIASVERKLLLQRLSDVNKKEDEELSLLKK